MIFRLIILNGDRKGQQINVPGDPLIIGRGPDAELSLNDPEIATHHAAVEHIDGALVIRDLGSMGKILVNNHEVRESGLVHGDVIEIGRTRMLVQAVVEAEVQNPHPPRRKRPGRRRGRLALLLALLLMAIALYAQRHQDQARSDAERDWSRPLSAGQPMEELEEIQAAVNAHSISPAPEPTPPPPAPPPTTTLPPLPAEPAPDPYELARDLLNAKVQNRMLEVQLLIASNRFVEADRLLGSIQQIAPEFAPSYAERAWLYEDRGMLQPALDQWRELIRRGGDAEMMENARIKIAKLGEARDKEVAKFSDQLHVVSTDQRRFPDSGDGSEMRLITIHVAAADQGQAIQPDAVRVLIAFFDQDTATGAIRRSRVSARVDPQGSLSPWQSGDVKTLTSSYVMPSTPGVARTEHYYGHVVRVFYHGALQDQYAQPKSLLDLLSNARPLPPETATP